MAELLGFEGAVKRIDKLAEDLENGTSKSKGKTTVELRELCGHYRVVPTAYKLEGVVKEGICALRLSQTTEIWKGNYKNEEVALKVLRVARDDHSVQRTKSRYCKEVVLMKQVTHDNILPFYGVSVTVSDFCLVFPWYENGNLMDHLKKNPGANRCGLLSGAVNGLRFLHDHRFVHGALQPSHVLVDNDGNARLATGVRSSIVAAPDTSIASHVPSAWDEGGEDYRYLAPEVQWPEDYGMDKVLITKESDVYGMAMVIYEVLTEKKPYFNCNDSNIVPKVQAGEIPERLPGRISDSVWELLGKCWSRLPERRPSAAELHDAFSDLSSYPQATHTQGRLGMGELPEKLELWVQSVRFSLDKSKKGRFYVKLKYGNRDHTTPLTDPVEGSGEYTWNTPESWVIETNKQYHGQLVNLELFLRMSLFKKDRVYATGHFSLLNNVNKQTVVKLEAPNSAGSTSLKILFTEM